MLPRFHNDTFVVPFEHNAIKAICLGPRMVRLHSNRVCCLCSIMVADHPVDSVANTENVES
jgi:hypothetical protein